MISKFMGFGGGADPSGAVHPATAIAHYFRGTYGGSVLVGGVGGRRWEGHGWGWGGGV